MMLHREFLLGGLTGGAALLAGVLAVTTAQAAVEIGAGKTKNMACSAGVCTPTAKSAVLNVVHLVRLLKKSDVKVLTGSGAVTIEVTAPLTWATTSRLTLDANCNVSIKAPVTVAGTGAMAIVANDGGSGCDLLFFPGGKIDFWDLSSTLLINGSSYTLASDIKMLGQDIGANQSGFFALSGDYDAAGDGTYAKSPIHRVMYGTLEGLGHAITNLSANKTFAGGMLGLFESIGNTGEVRDITLSNINLTCINGTYLGAIAGTNSGTIRAAFVTGAIAGLPADRKGDDENVGGLVGANNGTIAASTTAAEVSASRGSTAGGIAGRNNGTVIGSSVAGTVRATYSSYAGGLAGVNVGTLKQSMANAQVDSKGGVTDHGAGNSYTGGLAGYNSGQILSSHSQGSVAGGSGSEGTFRVSLAFAGGVAGWNSKLIDRSFAVGPVTIGGLGYLGGIAGENDSVITDSYALSPVTALGSDAGPGGLIGLNRGTPANDYSTGMVTGGDSGGNYGCAGGGFVSCDLAPEGNISNAYWDTDTSGIADLSHGAGNRDNDPGITGLSDAQLKAGLPAGFDPAVWGQDPNINNGYPYLLANPPRN